MYFSIVLFSIACVKLWNLQFYAYGFLRKPVSACFHSHILRTGISETFLKLFEILQKLSGILLKNPVLSLIKTIWNFLKLSVFLFITRMNILGTLNFFSQSHHCISVSSLIFSHKTNMADQVGNIIGKFLIFVSYSIPFHVYPWPLIWSI